MVAYVVGEVFVTDDSFAEEYRPKVKALIEKHDGMFISAGTFGRYSSANESSVTKTSPTTYATITSLLKTSSDRSARTEVYRSWCSSGIVITCY